MTPCLTRRRFIQTSAALAAATSIGPLPGFAQAKEPKFKISLAQWSLHRALRAKKIDNLDFAKITKSEFGIDAVEYVNQFFMDKGKDTTYLGEMKKRAADLGVTSVLIMIDGEGALGAVDAAQRKTAVENHHKWVEAAKFLGCHSIRVNAQTGSMGTPEEQGKRATEGLRALSEFAAPHKINVLVENHGGLSSNGKWLSKVISDVKLPNCGTLPDFGNFNIGKGEPPYDKYLGVTELMPQAKAVSAKSYDFDEKGNETMIDFAKMMKIVLDAGYRGYVGIEYEGNKLDEYAGVKATKALLERIQKETA